MSSPQLPSTPAWERQPPVRPVFTAAPAEADTLIRTQLSIGGPLWRLQNGSTGLPGYYRADESARHAALFIKVVARDRADALLEADRYARFATDHGIAAACLLDQYTKSLSDDHFALTHIYCDARLAELSAGDLSSLGKTVGKLHRALRDAPFQHLVKQNAHKRQTLLRETQRSLDCSTTPVHDDAVHLIERGSISYPDTGWPDQIIHGDINYGNVLFPSESPDKPMLLDFEDTRLAWHSPLVDIAFILERFILARTKDDMRAYSLAGNLIDAYVAQNSQASQPVKAGCLSETLKSLSIRALCLLIALSRNGATVAESEWEKFISLHNQALQRNELLNEIETLLR